MLRESKNFGRRSRNDSNTRNHGHSEARVMLPISRNASSECAVLASDDQSSFRSRLGNFAKQKG